MSLDVLPNTRLAFVAARDTYGMHHARLGMTRNSLFCWLFLAASSPSPSPWTGSLKTERRALSPARPLATLTVRGALSRTLCRLELESRRFFGLSFFFLFDAPHLDFQRAVRFGGVCFVPYYGTLFFTYVAVQNDVGSWCTSLDAPRSRRFTCTVPLFRW